MLASSLLRSAVRAGLAERSYSLSAPRVATTDLLINGKFVHSQDGKRFDTINPATEEVITTVAYGGAHDVNAAVAAARYQFDEGPWSKMSGAERGRLVNKLADLIEQHSDELAALESLDNGKPAAIARAADLPLSVACYRYYAGWADKNLGSVMDTQYPVFAYTRHVPVGVVGAIIPWNFPLLMQAWKLGPALAAGCTVVLKPAEQTPLTALRVGELALEAGFPAGVLNIVPGFGDTGALVANHPGVDKVAFTGSTEVGKLIMKNAAASLKRVTLELGGKSPFLVLKDAPVDQAVQAAHDGLFFNQGQCCCASSRVLVQEEIFEEFKEKSVRLAESRVVGDPFHPTTQQGPQVDRDQFDKILELVDSGKKDKSASLLTGGGRHGNKGFFIQPTIFATDGSDSARVVQEEIFGPVICIMPFKTIDEAVRRANSSMYGLAAGVYTKDVQLARQVGHRLRAGTVWINTWNQFDAGVPFGGFKESGIGRELGEYGLRNFTEVQSVTQNLAAY